MKINKNHIKNYHDAVEFVDYMVLSLDSGHNIQQAFLLSTLHLSEGSFQKDCFEVIKLYELGCSFGHALTASTELPLSPISRDIFENLMIGMRYGASVATTLSHLRAQVKLNLMSKMEELAHEAPIKMIFPLVIFIFPVLFILFGTKTFFNFILSLGA